MGWFTWQNPCSLSSLGLWSIRMCSWSVGINQWILSDGNYADFRQGEMRQFALEFYSKDFVHSDSPVKTAELIGKATYRVNALVEYIDKDMWVLDFGIKAYRLRPDDCGPAYPLPEAGRKEEDFVSSCSVGQAVKCTLYLSIDHYAYMESLCSKPGSDTTYLYLAHRCDLQTNRSPHTS